MNNWKKIFTIIWTGQLFSLLTSSIGGFAIIVWISLQTQSTMMLAYVAIATLLPQMVISPFAGVFIDRWDRKKVMMFSDAFVALGAFILAALFFFEVIETWHLFVIAGLRSIGSAFHAPAMQASVPLLAPKEQMMRIAGINQIINSASSIVGPALGVLFVSLWNMEWVLMLDVAGAAIAITSLLFIHIPNPEKKPEVQKATVFVEMRQGVQAILENKGLSWVFLFLMLSCMLYQSANILFPLMSVQHFNGDESHIGLAQALWAAGSFVGGVIMGIKTYKFNRVALINMMYILMGITFLFIGLLPQSAFGMFVVFACVGGLFGAVLLSAVAAVIQTHVDPAALGRVFSIYYTLIIAPSLIGLLITGFCADQIGLPTSYVILGSMLAGLGVLAFLPSSSIKMDRRYLYELNAPK